MKNEQFCCFIKDNPEWKMGGGGVSLTMSAWQ